MLSSSSSTRQAWQWARLRRKRSLKRPTTSVWLSVRKRECTSMAMEYSWRREVSVLMSSTTMPPPSTVSMVRARRLGVSAWKSCRISIL